MRRTHVLTANIARMAIVTSRTRRSLIVVHVKTARATYAASATIKRFIGNRISKCWCTGEDSNLRTSQGGADLQSAGFNHSPTCAEMPVARLSTFPAAFARTATCARRVCACSKNPTGTERAHNSSCAQFTATGKASLWNAARNLPCRRAAQMPCVPEPMLELAKGFEPLTL